MKIPNILISKQRGHVHADAVFLQEGQILVGTESATGAEATIAAEKQRSHGNERDVV